MSEDGKFWNNVKVVSKKTNYSPVQIGQILTLAPLSIKYQGLELSFENGDTIYINNLLLDENIELDVPSMDEAQNINPALLKADNTPTPTVEISGTQKQFLTDLYTWIKSVHNRFILHVGDYVTLQKLGNNTYLVLEKVQKIEQ
jgi:hypothetical protein